MPSAVLRAALLRSSGLKPTWAHSFLNGTVPAGAVFSRASTGSYYNSAGLLVAANSNVPRFDTDPTTLRPLGYFAEMASTNSLVQSQNFSTGWASTNVALTGNAVTAPDGTTTGGTMLQTSATGVHQIQSTGISATTGSVYGCSMFVKNIVGNSWMQFAVAGNIGFNFNPSSGTLGSNLSGSGLSNVRAQQLVNGWWRLSFMLTSPFTSSTSLQVYFSNAGNAAAAPSYAGDGTSTIAVWGFQFETAGVGVTSYIPTTASAASRSQDVLTLPLASLPGWSASKGGVLVAAYRLYTIMPTTPGYASGVVSVNDGTTNNQVALIANNDSGPNSGALMFSGGSSLSVVATGAVPAVGIRNKQAMSWQANRVAMAANGSIAGASTGVLALPVGMTGLDFGTYSHSNQGLEGAIESIAYYAGVRTDAFLAQVSR